MRVCFVYSHSPRERLLAEAVVAGARVHGDEAWMAPKVSDVEAILKEDADVYAMAGVKSRELYNAIHRRSAHTVLFDKGYSRQIVPGGGPRRWEYWRVAIDAQHPSRYMMDREYPLDRFEKWNVELKPWRADGRHVLFAGSSDKYHAFHELPTPSSYAERISFQITKMGRRVLYRPKPSWRDKKPVPGTDYSIDEHIGEALKDAWCLITHGSNAALDAILAGVPSVILGDGVAQPISSTKVEDVLSPRMVSFGERLKWLAAVSYAQFTQDEMASGYMWGLLRTRLLS